MIEAEVPGPMNSLGESGDFFASFAEAVEAARPTINLAALIGHTTLR